MRYEVLLNATEQEQPTKKIGENTTVASSPSLLAYYIAQFNTDSIPRELSLESIVSHSISASSSNSNGYRAIQENASTLKSTIEMYHIGKKTKFLVDTNQNQLTIFLEDNDDENERTANRALIATLHQLLPKGALIQQDKTLIIPFVYLNNSTARCFQETYWQCYTGDTLKIFKENIEYLNRQQMQGSNNEDQEDKTYNFSCS